MQFRYSFLFLIGTFLVNLSCKKQANVIPESGVSIALNDLRKKTIDSVQYAIELNIPALKNEAILGKVVVSFHLNSLDQPVILDFSNDSSYVSSVRSAGKEVSYSFVNQHIVIETGNLKKGKNEISIDFKAGDMSLNRSEEYLYTLFVPDRASTCFPLFDQPNLKASYELTLKTPAGWEAVSNGALKAKSVKNEKGIFHFEKTKPISSYLFAFAAGKFFKTEKSVNGRAMTMYYRETDTIKVARNRDEVFELHAKALNWLEDYTAIKYPFGKFDFVLIPSFQYGGMEHPGSIFYNESALFLDENASVNKKLSRASVIAHESAHMWFGDLVTMDWFNDVWLKEVFANFMAAKIVHPGFPEINHNLRFLLAHYPGAYEVDRTAGTNPVLQELGNLKNAGTLYGAIIYQKAPIVMRQLERKIGEKMMRESLQEYLKTYAFGNAKWDDLIGIIDKNSPLDIADWSNVWVKTGGMPEYDLTKENSRIKIRQKADSVSNRIWQQSLSFGWKNKGVYQENTLNIIDSKPGILNTNSASFSFPNADGIGYGYFKMDSASLTDFNINYNSKSDSVSSDPVFRGAMLVNQWEGLVRGDGISPEHFVINIAALLPKEENPLLVDYLLGNLQTAWWAFLTDEIRQSHQEKMEKLLWTLLEDTKDKGIKTSYFRAFKNMVMTTDGLKKLEGLWTEKLIVKDLVLSEEDNISLACEIALKDPENQKTVLIKQLSNTKNPDRKARMQFVIPALSNIENERDIFFESLKKPENREKEAWVLDALSYLHHPLRQKSALKYLRPSLDMLQEIQLTGDIFFPTRWTHNIFAGHSSPEAAEIANQFLKANPDYPYYLKNKVLQATDMLDRAVKLKKQVFF
ncbi:M1 family aminopeptidase [Dyadobacter sp. NIV53]|uniref:M1 family aminopeptidase n=1 Tax=Dyadobacter sp. NIV53 TaxID=2861765 RepID=UPI001C86FF89|nr:M1 family aminopeptidase [Dyadobacter sp. NIV53]